ncbi:MAG: HAD family hydrolase [Lentisphaerae bacterium GWF2_44_16]|nr:MAG: HAD family hydrolase [Lentisphaerae bacterium GWF2_44_16]
MKIGFLIDMDGVIYKENDLIPGAINFINYLISNNIPFLFLTNNSRKTRRDTATKLKRMGMPIEEKHVFTCAMATARFLAKQKPHGTAFVVGEGGLLHALHTNGYSIVDHDPDYVVVGEGTTFNFQIIESAVHMIMKGAKLISTNPDVNCPTPKGIRPGCGAIVSMIEKATGIEAFSVGKPSPVMMREARKEIGMESAATVMIGDTMSTDILGGIQMGYRTVLVLTGSTKTEDLKKYAFSPDFIVPSIAEIPIKQLLQPIRKVVETQRNILAEELTG